MIHVKQRDWGNLVDRSLPAGLYPVHVIFRQGSVWRYADRDILRVEINLRLIRELGINGDWFLVQINIG